MLKNNFIYIWLVVGIFYACDDNLVERLDPEEQRALDNASIDAYIAEKGYNLSDIDTTETGIRVVLLDSGQGPEVDYGDIVSLHLTGRFDEGSIFDTSIDTVAINNDIFDSTRVYSPLIFTHSQEGWALSEVRNVRDERFWYLCSFTGFTHGVTTAMEKINVGGKAVIITPSALSLSTSTLLGISDEIFIFELYPVHVK